MWYLNLSYVYNERRRYIEKIVILAIFEHAMKGWVEKKEGQVVQYKNNKFIAMLRNFKNIQSRVIFIEWILCLPIL